MAPKDHSVRRLTKLSQHGITAHKGTRRKGNPRDVADTRDLTKLVIAIERLGEGYGNEITAIKTRQSPFDTDN